MRFPLLALALSIACAPAPAAMAHEFGVGDLEIGHPFSLETMAPNGAGYMTVTNRGGEPDALLAVEAGFAAVTLHRTEIDASGVASMTREERLVIAPGETLVLEPGGAHVMFEGLDGDPLEPGESIPATLVFERAGRVAVEFRVEPLSFVTDAAPAATDHEGMDHGTMGAAAD